MGRLSRPLNHDAVRTADDDFYAKHPELVKNGKRIPLSAIDPSQADLREEWADLYKKHGGKEEGDQNKPPAKKPDDPVQPCPLTVPNTYGKGIKLEGNEEFRKKTIAELDRINKTPSGAKMLKSIDDSGKTVTIKQTSDGNGASPADISKAKLRSDGKPGEGSDTTVKFNPDKTQIGDGSEAWMKRPPGVGLAHEMVHAYHNANGTNDFTAKGEDMAVGVAPYDKEPVTENKIREEWDPKQPLRPHY